MTNIVSCSKDWFHKMPGFGLEMSEAVQRTGVINCLECQVLFKRLVSSNTWIWTEDVGDGY